MNKNKQELFDYVQKYNGVTAHDLIRIPEISYYCHNYYKDSEDYILFGHSNDDNYTEWWLCDKQGDKLVCFGESFTSEYEEICVFDKISMMYFCF